MIAADVSFLLGQAHDAHPTRTLSCSTYTRLGHGKLVGALSLGMFPACTTPRLGARQRGSINQFVACDSSGLKVLLNYSVKGILCKHGGFVSGLCQPSWC